MYKCVNGQALGYLTELLDIDPEADPTLGQHKQRLHSNCMHYIKTT